LSELCEISIYAQSVPRIHAHNGIDATPLADSSISLTINCTHSGIRCVLRSSVKYFVVCCFRCRAFNTTKLLNHAVPYVELMMNG